MVSPYGPHTSRHGTPDERAKTEQPTGTRIETAGRGRVERRRNLTSARSSLGRACASALGSVACGRLARPAPLVRTVSTNERPAMTPLTVTMEDRLLTRARELHAMIEDPDLRQ